MSLASLNEVQPYRRAQSLSWILFLDTVLNLSWNPRELLIFIIIFVERPNVKCSTLKPLFIYTFFADQIVFREKNVRSAAPYRGSQLEKSVPGRSLVQSLLPDSSFDIRDTPS